MSKLKIGIIGCGKITEVRHAPEYAENPDCELVAYYDALPERAEAMAKLYGGKAVGSVAELLDSGVDAVSVCVANIAHARDTILALNAGKHVLCEKPMAVTLEECEAMVAAASHNKKMLVIGHNQRLARAHQEAQRLIASGAIGRPLAFRTAFGHSGPEIWTGDSNSWFTDKKLAAFGVMADLGDHKIDVAHYLLGDEIDEVTAYVETLDKKTPGGEPISVDDNAMCLLRTKGGVIGTLHASWTFYGPEDNSTVVYGSAGVIRCFDDPANSLVLQRKDGTEERFDLDPMITNKEQTSGQRRNTGVIDDFVKSIQTGVPSVNDGREAVKSMRVVFASLRSAEEGRTIKI